MPLSPGTRLGAYEIVAAIGAGGMGEVYRARDTRLKRDVAVKVLPDAFSQDPDRLARFQREAEVLATLNHPNIAAVYGLEQANGIHAIVMELVEGQTLADLVRRGPMAVPDALRIAGQLTDALDAAHEKGIVHRDLKPANVKITPEGVVKVLDFGLAKAAASSVAGETPPSQAPTTMTLGGTREGVILGTASYMSPEQARGQTVDRRTDVWAFGCVLYEMLTGRRAFDGATTTDILAAVLDREPDWSVLPIGVPSVLRRVLRRCLEKDPKRRFRDIGDAGADIVEARAGDVRDDSARSQPSSKARVIGLTAAAVVVAVGVGAAVWISRNSPSIPAARELRLEITTPWTKSLEGLAVSPDGATIVTVAATSGIRTGLWLRELNSGISRPLGGSDGATYPFWSPDGRSIGFFADGKLKRIDLAGGAAQTLADAPNAQGGTWSRDGTILFTPTQILPIHRVTITGGSIAVTRLEPSQLGHLHPQFLPDGIHFLYFASGTADKRGVYVARLDGSDVRRLMDANGPAIFAPPGYLLFVRGTVLFAQPFDPVKLALGGDAIRVDDDVENVGSWPALSAAASGAIVYRARSPAGDHQLVWYDRAGSELTRLGEPSAAGQAAAVSPDGRQMALGRVVDGKRDIWLLELARGVLSRFTADGGVGPLWMPDGSGIVFASNRGGGLGVYRKSIVSSVEEPLVVVKGENANVADISPDGRVLLYHRADRKTRLDIWALPLESGGAPFPVVQTSGEDVNGQFAPNGTWLAYQSDESDRYQVSVRSFRGSGRAIQVTADGGTQPRWRRDGRELFYLDLDGRLMAVPITFTRDGQSVDVGVPSPLFQTRIGGANISQRDYLVAPDGQRFLLDTPVGDTSPPIKVILNWRP